jgi:hypothetical protein
MNGNGDGKDKYHANQKCKHFKGKPGIIIKR